MRKFSFVTVLLFASSLCLAQLKFDYVPCNEMPYVMQQYNADYEALQRFYTPSGNDSPFGYGRRDYNGAASPEKRARMEKLYNEYLQKLSMIDFNKLPQECKADYILFKRDLDASLKQSATKTAAYEKIKQWVPFADNLFAAEKLRRRGTQLDAEKMAKEWSDIGNAIKSMEAKLKDDKTVSLESTYDAIDNIRLIKAAAENVYQFYNGYDPAFTWWMPKPYKTLDSLLGDYANAFRKKRENIAMPDKSGIIGQPVGRDELVRQLQYEMIPYSPEELIDIANKEFAWCEKEMLKASRDMGFGDDWKAAEEKVKNSYVPVGKQPEMILGLYQESIDFLKKHDLITIPPLAEETWGMYMMSPERQLVNPFFLGGESIIISYPTNTMTEDEKLMSMRGNNPHFSRATVHHELIAGHNLEFFMNERYRSYRNFNTPFWVEGWSLYWELLLWDLGFAKTPEDRIGMLFWHMHRCARIIFSLNYHIGKWTPQQCIDFLVDKVNHERANAEGEVRRSFEGGYPPLYQLAYLTGGRQFYALKKELVDSGKMTYKQFHDSIMHLNCMPIEMIRAILTNQPLSKDYKTSWKFYNQPGN
ncbi:MAG: DUF885 family protein [Bacteroidetes bacterium]|nr:DUF885 family protein [Bacteroidota bacterium]MBS1973292.1 DUF885 family protein [Bacteroidota bacterium]